jgi:SAM-dependent methyltransferase
MLEVARQRAPALEWREGVAESLPFADGSFDAVVSQFALMFFTDRPRALREMMRVLAPGGRLVVAVWDSLHSMPAYAAEVALLARTAGQAAADALSAPFVLGDRHRLGELFEEAGVSAVDVTTRPGTARFPSLRTLVEADLRGWLPLVGIVLAEDLIGRILQEAEKELAAYATTDGRAEFGLSTLFATATKA